MTPIRSIFNRRPGDRSTRPLLPGSGAIPREKSSSARAESKPCPCRSSAMDWCPWPTWTNRAMRFLRARCLPLPIALTSVVPVRASSSGPRGARLIGSLRSTLRLAMDLISDCRRPARVPPRARGIPGGEGSKPSCGHRSAGETSRPQGWWESRTTRLHWLCAITIWPPTATPQDIGYENVMAAFQAVGGPGWAACAAWVPAR